MERPRVAAVQSDACPIQTQNLVIIIVSSFLASDLID